MSATTKYCYHCGTHHRVEDMRRIETRAGPRWRCLRSIQAAKSSPAQRAAFGRQTTEINRRASAASALRVFDLSK